MSPLLFRKCKDASCNVIILFRFSVFCLRFLVQSNFFFLKRPVQEEAHLVEYVRLMQMDVVKKKINLKSFLFEYKASKSNL